MQAQGERFQHIEHVKVNCNLQSEFLLDLESLHELSRARFDVDTLFVSIQNPFHNLPVDTLQLPHNGVYLR